MAKINPLIPRQILFAEPQKQGVKFSPDGKYVSFLALHEQKLTLWLALKEKPHLAQPILCSVPYIRDYEWASTSDHLLYLHDKAGDENWQLSGFQLSTSCEKNYTPVGLQAKILHISPRLPNRILITLNQRDRRFHDVYELMLNTGELQCQFINNEFWDFSADDNLKVRAAIKIAGGGREIVLFNAQGAAANLVTIAQHDLFGLFFNTSLRMSFSHNDSTLYFVQTMRHDTSSLMAFDLTTGVLTAMGNQAQADICDILKHPLTHQPLAYAINADRKKWFPLNLAIAQDFQQLNAIADGDITILSQTTDNYHWVVALAPDQGAIQYYHYDRQQGRVNVLYVSHTQLAHYALRSMQSNRLTMRDGVHCMSFLTRSDPQLPTPLVLLVHGGPNYRDFWGFNPLHQWLANRGYAVLSVNYRGSLGYGNAHLAAGHGEWADKIQDDLWDAVQWAIAQKIALPEKIAIMGTSFGGYSTLVALTQTPERFCCGIDLVGASNLITVVQNFPPYWQIMNSIIHQMLGCDPNTPAGEAFLKQRSPLFHAHRITKPLLIGHGAHDVQIRQSESDSMVAALQRNGVPVSYVLFPDEGHRLRQEGNRMAFYGLVENFLAKILPGRAEKYDPNISTALEVKVDDFSLLA